MKRIISLLLVLAVAIAGVSASDFHFYVDDIDQHPEILIGFIPTYFAGGVGYTGFSLLEDNTTEIRLSAGAGYVERRFWIDPENGEETHDIDPLTFDVVQVIWGLSFNQGFLESPVGGKDFITLSIGYEGRYEDAMDSLIAGRVDRQKRSWGDDYVVGTIDQFFGGTNECQRLYPDLRGNHQYLGTNLNFKFTLDAMEDTLSTNDGYLVTFEADWSPYALNKALDGTADFYQFTLQGIAAKTLYQHRTEKMNWFSVVIIDRLRANWLSGELVPTYVQRLGSLGRLVRGYSNYTYGTEFTAVNSFEFRLVGPSMGVNGLAPRINIFFDMGYGAGNYYNTSIKGNSFLASTGAQFTVTFFDFIDLGYQVAWLIGDGRNFSKGDTVFSGSFTFFLDF